MEHKTYLKFTGDTVIVLFSSNIIVPFTVGSFLLVLNQANQQVINIECIHSTTTFTSHDSQHKLTCTPFSQSLDPVSPIAHSTSSATETAKIKQITTSTQTKSHKLHKQLNDHLIQQKN